MEMSTYHIDGIEFSVPSCMRKSKTRFLFSGPRKRPKDFPLITFSLDIPNPALVRAYREQLLNPIGQLSSASFGGAEIVRGGLRTGDSDSVELFVRYHQREGVDDVLTYDVLTKVGGVHLYLKFVGCTPIDLFDRLCLSIFESVGLAKSEGLESCEALVNHNERGPGIGLEDLPCRIQYLGGALKQLSELAKMNHESGDSSTVDVVTGALEKARSGFMGDWNAKLKGDIDALRLYGEAKDGNVAEAIHFICGVMTGFGIWAESEEWER